MHHDAIAAIIGFVRTTVVIDSDVAGEIERLRREGMGLSEALNLLARRGMTRGPHPSRLCTSIGPRVSA
ncbi:copG family DNA-binding protein [Mycobacterium kansasii 824]|nr:copG family DNA-binding protein [Mycobacterium kansasii 824]